MSMTRIYSDGRREDWPDSQPQAAETCTNPGAFQAVEDEHPGMWIVYVAVGLLSMLCSAVAPMGWAT